MRKRFNDTGTCFPDRNYMVDISNKIEKITNMIDLGDYFIINRPRQYGKTTTLEILYGILQKRGYLPILMSFERSGDESYKNVEVFSKFFLEKIYKGLKDKSEYIIPDNFNDLSNQITEINEKYDKKIILLIDEIDKSSNNQLFINFWGMLRDKYLSRNREATFHSIILAGLHDIKTLKLKLRPDEETKYNSPWNIAAEFKVDMSFDTEEIETMLVQYVSETGIKMDTKEISEKIYFYTSGYPYFVSKLCKIIDEEMRIREEWQGEHIIDAVKILLNSIGNSNFDTIIKNLENNKELYDFIGKISLNSETYDFTNQIPIIDLARMNGLIKNENGKVRIHNKIYEEYIGDYYIGKMKFSGKGNFNSIQSIYLKSDGRLDIKEVLIKFQEVIEEKYSNTTLLKSEEFLENDLRLLFLVFLKPIINGTGFSFKEVQTSAEKRLDVIVIFLDEKFIIELKMWYGDKYHQEGIEQIKGYMKREHVNEGYMIVMCKNQNKEFRQSNEDGIFTIWM